GQRLVRQRVVRVLSDLEVEAGFLGEVVVDELEDVTVRDRGHSDVQLRDVAVLLTDTVGAAADESAAGQQQGGPGRNGDEFGLHCSPLMCSLCCMRKAVNRWIRSASAAPRCPAPRWLSGGRPCGPDGRR